MSPPCTGSSALSAQFAVCGTAPPIRVSSITSASLRRRDSVWSSLSEPAPVNGTMQDCWALRQSLTRARILYALGTRYLCVRDPASVVGVSESAVSHQLRLLRDRRVVTGRRSGNVIYYSVDDQHVAALIREAEYHA